MRRPFTISLFLLAATVRSQYIGGTGGGGITNCMASFAMLPVELLHFTAMPNGDQVQLQWATASELNNAGFHIERSTDGLRFDAIAEMAGAGNSVHLVEYNALDRSPVNGTGYYRLLQTDFDGSTNYSDVVSVTIAKSELVVYPNPADDQVWLTGTTAGEEVTLLDAMGRTLHSATATDGTFMLDISALPAGRYVIRLVGAGGMRTLPVLKR